MEIKFNKQDLWYTDDLKYKNWLSKDKLIEMINYYEIKGYPLIEQMYDRAVRWNLIKKDGHL